MSSGTIRGWGTGNDHPAGRNGARLRPCLHRQTVPRPANLTPWPPRASGERADHVDKKTGTTVDRDGSEPGCWPMRGPETPSWCTPSIESAATCARSSISCTVCRDAASGYGRWRTRCRSIPPTRAWAASRSSSSRCSPRWNEPSPPSAPPMPVPSPRPPAARSAGRSPTPEDKIEYARLLKAQGDTLSVIAAKTGIPKTSLHRYLSA